MGQLTAGWQRVTLKDILGHLGTLYSGCVLLHRLPSQVSSPCFAKRQVFKKRRALTRLQATSPESVHIGKVPFLYPGKTGVGLQSCKGNLAIFATAVLLPSTCHA
ncbi:unnamed protein product [Effrenium voratum]|nr:unnamed protein product [Effrenium voratum]